jgi:capsular polysaccharide export protein
MHKPTSLNIKKYFFTAKPKVKDILFYILNIVAIFSTKKFQGWGRKKTGEFAFSCYKKFGGQIIRYEDGFIRSLGLGVNGHPSFSLVEDNVGLFLDATQPSQLENILNKHPFADDLPLMATAKEAISMIQKHHISKYNHAPDIDDKYFIKDHKNKILIIAQTAGDASLKYGLADSDSADKMLKDAISENPSASIYLKIHPDVLAGKKKSNITVEKIPQECKILDQDINPISLLKHFDTIYTCTSGMGMEALILNKKVICYGMPFYAGWGLTMDKQTCSRRKRTLTTTELFAGAYILYTQYYNPYTNQPSDIIKVIQEIAMRR